MKACDPIESVRCLAEGPPETGVTVKRSLLRAALVEHDQQGRKLERLEYELMEAENFIELNWG